MSMMSETIEDMLIRHEGMKLKPYRCSAGKLTIGIGRNLEDKGISRGEAMTMLLNDITSCRADLSHHEWYLSQNEARRKVLINMRFNLGMPRLLGFKKMIAALRVGNYEVAAYEMLDSKWARDVGDRAHELARIMDEGEEDEL